ncbi:ATP-binding protein [Streptomyces rubiginosohelvolus]|uniref:ATP-binding protein n=1 Tax=Streptomyces rubiginosohelvolus TaxID=67362 RepID=UPI00367D05CE
MLDGGDGFLADREPYGQGGLCQAGPLAEVAHLDRRGVPPGRGFKVHIYLERVESIIRVEMHDSGGGVVCAADGPPEADDEGGRGLLLVAALADKWGVAQRNPGKVVWCEFSIV